MQTPEPIKQHPNATFVASMAPPAALIAWLVSLAGLKMPQEAAAGISVMLTSCALVFATGVKRCGSNVWEFGIIGCWRRIWRGNPSKP
jgi:hypothetical protein